MEDRSVTIGERNKVAMDALRRAMDRGHNKIAILYGKGHMQDLGRRLQEEFDLFPSQVQWITAWSMRSRGTKTTSFPFLTGTAQVLGSQMLALLGFSFGLAFELSEWRLFFIFFWRILKWISEIVFLVDQYLLIAQMM